jgi:putative MATE family efflux protein
VNAPTTGRPSDSVAKFTQGSTMRHVVTMTAAAAIGLLAIFIVDFLSLLYISWLGRTEWTAGVGFASAVLFVGISMNIGLLIAVGALVSRALGERDVDKARRLAGSTAVLTALTAGAFGFGALPFIDPRLSLLGAVGEAHDVARRFLMIVLPSNIIMGFGLSMQAIMRAAGDARRSMYVTLSAAILTAIIDPILIFGLKLGTDGAAISIVIARLALVVVGLWGAVAVHGLVALPRFDSVIRDARSMYGIAVPAILANIATPIANGFMMGLVARFGDAALAAFAFIDRIVPLAFCGLFALSASVGPILGQNWGARRFDRLRQILQDALVFTGIYVVAVWVILLVARNLIPLIFNVSGTTTGELIVFFILVSGPTWLFLGGLFVSNAAFNNLGYPLYSTLFNWGRASLGTLPFAVVGARIAGVEGMMVGILLGAFVFGVASALTAFWAVNRVSKRDMARLVMQKSEG